MHTVADEASRLVLRHLGQAESLALGTIAGYDPATHRARVRLQPSGVLTGALPVGVPAYGHSPHLERGSPCAVGLVRGSPVCVLCVLYSARAPVPADALVVGGDALISGTLDVAGPLLLGRAAALPPTSAALRGALLVLSPSADATAGTADSLRCCLQSAGGTLSWVNVATG